MAEERYLDETALERLRKLGGPEFLVKMIDVFLANAPRRIEAARAGQSAGDLEAVEHAAHSLRSSAGNLGAGTLRDLAEKIERLTEERRSDGLPDLLDKLESTFARVRACLEEERRKLQA